MKYIRNYYNVPAKRGGRIFYEHKQKYGTIKSASGAYLKIQLDGEKEILPYHPTWKIKYL